MEMIPMLKERYDTYIQETAKRFAQARPTDGLFGWGDDPRRDPCHLRFYEDLERWCEAFLAGNPDRDAVYEAAAFMLEIPARYREQPCYWFMYAAQGLTRPMIPRLSASQCADLQALYDSLFPRRDRMPVQKDVYRLLKKGALRK